MKKRAAETLTEVVMAMTLFGIIMGGIFDFMGAQTKYVYQRNYHSQAMYYLQKFVNMGTWQKQSNASQDKTTGLKFSYTEDKNGGKLRIEEITLVSNDPRHVTFLLKPPTK